MGGTVLHADIHQVLLLSLLLRESQRKGKAKELRVLVYSVSFAFCISELGAFSCKMGSVISPASAAASVKVLSIVPSAQRVPSTCYLEPASQRDCWDEEGCFNVFF